MDRLVGGYEVRGVQVGPETRCAHYDGERDVIALRFGCCEAFFPCHACHEAVADHEAEPWPRDRFDEPAVLCGSCGTTLTSTAYLACDHACPSCGVAFNPGCVAHYDHYFEGG
ncbi:CHY zinc finger protein [Halobacteria archaeon AArc-dxtr1]|nr:CHY zinc finger protein [Halobacteria archaeon AArc-dxtr1]